MDEHRIAWFTKGEVVLLEEGKEAWELLLQSLFKTIQGKIKFIDIIRIIRINKIEKLSHVNFLVKTLCNHWLGIENYKYMVQPNSKAISLPKLS